MGARLAEPWSASLADTRCCGTWKYSDHGRFRKSPPESRLSGSDPIADINDLACIGIPASNEALPCKESQQPLQYWGS